MPSMRVLNVRLCSNQFHLSLYFLPDLNHSDMMVAEESSIDDEDYLYPGSDISKFHRRFWCDVVKGGRNLYCRSYRRSSPRTGSLRRGSQSTSELYENTTTCLIFIYTFVCFAGLLRGLSRQLYGNAWFVSKLAN